MGCTTDTHITITFITITAAAAAATNNTFSFQLIGLFLLEVTPAQVGFPEDLPKTSEWPCHLTTSVKALKVLRAMTKNLR